MDEVEHILEEARNAPSVGEALEAYGRAAAAADDAGDTNAALDARLEWMECAQFAGFYAEALGVFAWCIQAVDASDGAIEESRILWQYKWAVHAAMRLPDEPTDRVWAMTEDLQRRFTRNAWGPRGPALIRVQIADAFGDEAQLDALMRRWLACPPDDGQDCEACEHDTVVAYFSDRQLDPRAVDAAGQILDGTLSCHEVPGRTYARLIESWARLGQLDAAAAGYRHARAFVERQATGLDVVGRVARFLLWARQPEEASRLLARYAPDLARAPMDLDLVRFAATAGLVAQVDPFGTTSELAEEAAESLDVATHDLLPALAQRVAQGCAAFDQRHGNNALTLRLAADEAFTEAGRYIELDHSVPGIDDLNDTDRD